MTFDWKQFFFENSIPYAERGKNIGQGHIGIRCPMCGLADPSQHMSINLENGYWHCWRDDAHSGKRPHRLIMSLIGCSYRVASEIVGDGTGARTTSLDPLIASMKKFGNSTEVRLRSLEMPGNFVPIKDVGNGRMYFNYLASRGFKLDDVADLVEDFDLRRTTSGSFRYRVILPLILRGQLVSWTGRLISGPEHDGPRYKTLTSSLDRARKRGEPVAILTTHQILFNFDRLKEEGGDVLVVVEGPFDALKLDYYGRSRGIRATCLFTTSMSREQRWLLDNLASRFRRIYIMLDRGQEFKAIRIAASLAHIGAKSMRLPEGVEDPGDLSRQQILSLEIPN